MERFKWSFNNRGTGAIFIVSLTDNCNLACSYCYEKFKTKTPTKMSKETLKQFIDNLYLKHIPALDTNFTIQFFGGEPFLYPDLIEFGMSYIKEKYPHPNATYSVITNGTLLINREVQAVIIKYPELHLSISLDGDEKIQNKNRGQYQEIINGINWLKTVRGSNFTMQVTASPYNVDNLSDSFKHVVNVTGVNNVFMPISWDTELWDDDIYAETLYKELCIIAEFMCEPEQRYTLWCNVFNPQLYLPLGQMGKPACFSRKLSCDHKGNLYNCVSFKNSNSSVGNIKDWLTDDYYSLANTLSSQLKNFDYCRACTIASGCQKCYAYYELKNGSYLSDTLGYCKAQHACYYAMLHLIDLRENIVSEEMKQNMSL